MSAIEERRRRIVRAVVAVYDHPTLASMGDDRAVLPFQVVYFGVPACVKDVPLASVRRDLRWAELKGYLRRAERPRRGFAARVEYIPTEEGRAWCR